MKVQFTYSQEDMVDSTLRFLRRSKTFRSARWKQVVFMTLVCWLGLYVVFISFLGNPYLAVITGVVTAVSNAALSPFFIERATGKRLRKLLKESYGDKNNFRCEVELSSEEIRIQGENTKTVYNWDLVQEIIPTENSVDIFTRSGGVVVRNRAFESVTARDEFVTLARAYFAAAHSGNDEK